MIVDLCQDLTDLAGLRGVIRFLSLMEHTHEGLVPLFRYVGAVGIRSHVFDVSADTLEPAIDYVFHAANSLPEVRAGVRTGGLPAQFHEATGQAVQLRVDGEPIGSIGGEGRRCRRW